MTLKNIKYFNASYLKKLIYFNIFHYIKQNIWKETDQLKEGGGVEAIEVKGIV